MTTSEKIEIMQAYRKGAKLQVFIDGDWRDWKNTIEPNWNWERNKYRIKPGPTHRPYDNAVEMIADYKARRNAHYSIYEMPVIWLSNKHVEEYSLVTDFDYDGVCLGGDSYDYEDLFEKFTYLDGSPCGKLVEE